MSTEAEPNQEAARTDIWLILLLAAVTAIGPFAMHALAPALPSISTEFGVPAPAALLTLSLSLVAMAISNLIWGPLSDKFGRRPTLLAGMTLGVAGSVLAALAPELWMIILGRLLQAAGAAAGMVLARAVAQDLYGQTRAAAVIGQITGVMVAAPMLAPTIAGLVVDAAGWPGVFWMSAALCLMLCVWTANALQESAPKGIVGVGTMDMLKGFVVIGGRRAFWRYAGYAAFSLAGFYYFVAIAPYVMREAFGQSAGTYGLYFILLSGTFMFTNLIAARVSARFGGENVLVFGAVLSLVGPATVAVLLLSGLHHPLVLFLPGMVQSFGAGLATPNAMAGAVGAAPERAGAASGLLGFSQFIISAITTQMSGFMPHDTALVVPLGMGACLVIGVLFLVLLKERP